MTINKYFVLAPKSIKQEQQKENEVVSDNETQRQALVKQAQEQGGL